jgi:hypothetical protein
MGWPWSSVLPISVSLLSSWDCRCASPAPIL